jgi:hypothetical protein
MARTVERGDVFVIMSTIHAYPNAFPSPVSGEGEGEGNIREETALTFNPFPPNEGEEVDLGSAITA